MTEQDIRSDALFTEIHRLATECLEGGAAATTFERLNDLVSGNPEALDLYVEYLNDSIGLRHVCLPGEVSAPLPAFLTTTLPGTVGFFSSGWPVAYLVAAVIFGLAILIGSLVPVSQPVQVARQSSAPSRMDIEPRMEPVGKITGMVDCQWAGAAFESPVVPLGRKYELTSGLVKINYDTGAEVILQGPVKYQVESASGGYLAVGKLTGKVEVEKAKGFVVRTPSATVADLGTEFGVEVDERGGTTSYVFRGSVRLQVASADGKAEGVARVLHENQSASVANTGGNRIMVLASSSKPANFVRELPKHTIKTLDLADMVAGGDGFSGRRNRGIDQRNGQTTDTEPVPPILTGDHRYHRVKSLPFVDGVFIPSGKRPVQIDSAGHTFADFGETDNFSCGYIWSGRPPVLMFDPPEVHRTELAGVDYASPGHSVLFMHANKGITFDLESIRRANSGCKLLRFRGVTGNTEIDSQKGRKVRADIRILVDGQARFQRREISGYNGAMPIDIPLANRDRFLTLAATDSGGGAACNWIIFGDPRLIIMSKTSSEPNEGNNQ